MAPLLSFLVNLRNSMVFQNLDEVILACGSLVNELRVADQVSASSVVETKSTLRGLSPALPSQSG
jgi:hypothetical protein